MTMSRLIKKILIVLIVSISVCVLYAEEHEDNEMSKAEREQLKEEARDMFYHAYRAYMENAYPADELMPLSCKGRYRGVTPNRGDMDDILGNFSLTLVDSLDTLVILGDFEEFEHALKLIIKDVTFEKDIIVSVFETNIRMLGGLLSAHVLASGLQESGDFLTWYRGELLDMAHDLGKRLLPAFNTSTGIPHARVNLKYGMVGLEHSRETCTACAGTMILEMAALSRLTGEPVFEQKAHKAMDRLWKIRHRTSDLMGTVVNVHSGDWIRKDSGVGAGIDSYYEYCLKAYILLGDETYLARFNRHYNAVMKYISRGPMMFDVHMHRPHTQSRHFMDALLAFWPGLQVLLGDVRPAVETHEMLYQVMQRHTFIPEAFTADFQVHWGQHPLRPEFLESTYFLHRATGDDHYLRVGKAALKSLQKHARVPCGYAAVNDVRTRIHEDRMDSFVLAETFKYLYMMFSDDAELPINLDHFIFTTEAHLLPLSLASFNRNFTTDKSSIEDEREFQQYSRTCPNTRLQPETVRKPLKNMMGECRNHLSFRRLLARQFRPGDPEHVHTLAEMGISVLSLPDGRVQLLHTFSMAKSARDAEEGLVFMREMAELSERGAGQTDAAVKPKAVAIGMLNSRKVLAAGPAHFGPELKGPARVMANAAFVNPLKACSTLRDADVYKGKIIIAERGDCTFADKVRRLQSAGAVGVIITDNIPGSSRTASPLFAMSGDGVSDVNVPAVFLFSDDADILKNAVIEDPSVVVILGDMSSIESEKAELELEKDEIFEKSVFHFRLNELSKIIATYKHEILVSFESKSVIEEVQEELQVNDKVLESDQNKIHERNQAHLENYLSSVISRFDSQFYQPFFKVLTLKHKEYKNSKGNIKVVTKLIEEMTEVIRTISGKIYNYSNTIKSGKNLDKDLNEELKSLTKALKASEDDNIIVRDSIDTIDTLLGKLSDQVIEVNRALMRIKKMDLSKEPIAENIQYSFNPTMDHSDIDNEDDSIVNMLGSNTNEIPPR